MLVKNVRQIFEYFIISFSNHCITARYFTRTCCYSEVLWS